MSTVNKQPGVVVKLGDVRKAREEMSMAEDELIAIYERELKTNPGGVFNQFKMEDGSTRITATIPPGVDPEQFIINTMRKSRDMSSLF